MNWLGQIKPFIAWLHTHAQWVGLFTFFVAFFESLAVVGLILPGTVLMTIVGTFVGAGIVAPIPVFAWGTAGAFCGEVISFHIGYKFKNRIPEIWPFVKYPSWLPTAQNFFYRHGRKSIFIGRFIGPVRPILPMVAGMMQMPGRFFYSISFIACCLWPPILMLPGIMIETASTHMAPALGTHLVLIIGFTIIVLWLAFTLFKHLFRFIVRLIKARAAKKGGEGAHR